MKSDVYTKLSQVSLILSEVTTKMSNEECQQPQSSYLSAVGVILSQIEALVSMKLSSSRVSDDVCIPSSSSVYDNVCISSSSVNDDYHDASLDLEWDHNYNIIDSFYHLCYDDPDDVDMIPDDRDGVDMIPNDRDEVDMPDEHDEGDMISDVYDEGDIKATNEVDDDVTTTPKTRKDTNQPHDVFLTNLIASINNLAPANTYDARRSKRKRRRKIMKKVHPELVAIWTNAATIVSPATYYMQSTTSYFPNVDWKSVNKRFLSNIPVPSSLPIYGCSINPDNYEDVYERSDYGRLMNKGSRFTGDFPFGSELGFVTDAGAVRVPDEVFHGYVFEVGQGWILHADFPRKLELQNRRKKEVVRRKRRKNCGT